MSRKLVPVHFRVPYYCTRNTTDFLLQVRCQVFYFFNAILVLLKLRSHAPVSDRVFERRESCCVMRYRINEGQGRSVVMFSKGPPLVVVVVCESNSPPKNWEVTGTAEKVSRFVALWALIHM